MNLSYITDHLPIFAEAAALTIGLAIAGIVLSIVLGLACALIRYFKIPVIFQIASFYIELSRNTPLMIQLFFLYYGLTRVGIMLEQGSADPLYCFAPGFRRSRSRNCRKHDFPDQGNLGFQHHRPAGPDVCGQRPDEGRAQQRNQPASCLVLSGNYLACFNFVHLAGKEDAPCWTQQLTPLFPA